MPGFIIVDASDLKDFAKSLRKHTNGKELRKKLTRALRDEIRPAVQDVKSAYGGGKHLRPALRRATRMEVKTTGSGAGARIMVDGRRMPPGMGSLPAYREGLKVPWRHPTYGHDPWVTQAPVPVFYDTVRPYEEKVIRRLNEVAEEIAQEIAHG